MCAVDSKESERYHSTGSPMDRAPPGLQTDRDHLMKDILGRYCPKTFETAKGKMNCGTVGNRTTAIITYPTVIA